jgi:hypothetical protein
VVQVWLPRCGSAQLLLLLLLLLLLVNLSRACSCAPRLLLLLLLLLLLVAAVGLLWRVHQEPRCVCARGSLHHAWRCGGPASHQRLPPCRLWL